MSNVNNINKGQLDSSTQLHYLEQLPHSLLTEISTYLGGGNTGRHPMNTGSDVLLAVALTASQSSWEKCQYSGDKDQLLSPASKAVLKAQEDWEERFEIVDFGQLQIDAGSSVDFLERTTGSNLNDVDLKAILICMDAQNNVKSLKLTGCAKILGRGLEPLVGSTILERIDLSLVTSPKCAKYVKDIELSEEIILPLLRSFFGLSLRHIQLPWVWRQKKSPMLTLFLQDYSSHLEKLELICQHTLKQGAVSRECENESDVGMHLSDERYGIQTATCFDCLKHFCLGEDCCGEDEFMDSSFDFCSSCEKYHCNGCDLIMYCSKCDKSSCRGCFDVHFCQDCSSAFCMDCKMVNYCSKCFNAACWDCKPPMFCSQCMKTECIDCCEMIHCSECFDCFCMDCGADKIRYSALRNEILCSTCFGG